VTSVLELSVAILTNILNMAIPKKHTKIDKDEVFNNYNRKLMRSFNTLARMMRWRND
jgi:hypothetical protein